LFIRSMTPLHPADTSGEAQSAVSRADWAAFHTPLIRTQTA
jgi:hypothetical protein